MGRSLRGRRRPTPVSHCGVLRGLDLSRRRRKLWRVRERFVLRRRSSARNIWASPGTRSRVVMGVGRIWVEQLIAQWSSEGPPTEQSPSG